jgi:uncharacterized membrane protein YraQ (UPF0718 family)
MEPLQTIPMQPVSGSDCDCTGDKPQQQPQSRWHKLALGTKLAIGGVALVAWYLAYKLVHPLSEYLTFELLGLDPDSRFGSALQFFLYDTPKILLLLSLVVFGVGILRSFITPERARSLLVGKNLVLAHVLASVTGIVTPFCSCSAIPLFIGFMTAGIPLGVTFSYLIAAPMINEVALIMLYGLLGWKVAAIYVGTGLFIAITAGLILGRLKMENQLEDWVLQTRSGTPLTMSARLTWHDRIDLGLKEVRDIVGKVWYYVVAGILVGAGIHGFVPEGAMAQIMGKGAWWSVPVAVGLGIPMYSSAAGMIPVVDALLSKGAALGTALAFMMSVIALSLPEIMILRRVLKPRLIVTFVAIVAGGILTVGSLFNMLIG